MTTGPDLSEFKSELSFKNRLARALWGVVWVCLFRPSPRPLHGWRRLLLSLFGAKLGRRTRVYPSARIWAPWNLTMDDYSTLGDAVDCYTVAPIHLGEHVVVSQYVFLCAATHDFRHARFPLVPKPITIETGAWVAAGAFVGPGVTVGEGAVVGARAVVTRDVKPWDIVVGNPAEVVGRREVKGDE